jgi:phthiocerol/phenolphthiocerol synthesis type-I polyketide synthase C
MVESTYVGAVREALARDGDRPLLTFLADGTGDGITWTCTDLHREASQVARLLRDSVAPGDRVLIMAAPGLDYVAAFFGCLFAGVIAVPAYPPTTLNARHGLERIYAILQDAQVAAILADDAVSAALAPYGSYVPQRLLTMDDARRAGGGDDVVSVARADDIAFLQYTSGSTGDPKGVMVTQGNLVAQVAMMRAAYPGTGEVLFSWLPPYHDMGLIGMLLTAPVHGLHTVFMPPTVFLRQPVRWLQGVSRFGAQISGAPNFAYEACVRKVKDADLDGVDLSCWRVAINGAEPVRASTVERFVERFGHWGFRREAFHPAYGLAEATLMTATASLGHGASVVEVDATALGEGRLSSASGSDERRALVTCGHPAVGAQITVVDPGTGVPRDPGEVGELVVRGPHVTRGYWGRDDDERFSDGSVRTGDLGAFLDGELVVTGRLKDLIVIRGRNHYPHDIERTVEQAHPGLRPGCGAAFTVDRDGEERLVVVQEVAPGQMDDPAAAVDAIRRGITITHGIASDGVVLVTPGAVAKTSSGKVRRHDTRRLYLTDALGTVFAWSSGRSLQGVGSASSPDGGSPESEAVR